MRPLRRLAVLLGLIAPLSACDINPETGKISFNVVSPEAEREIGAESHGQVLEEFGGVYYDPELTDYIDRIGQKMAAQSAIRNFDYRFTVLDSPSINAFALPGGYVYITRGLLALLGSEAELAAVLGHELAHVTARHGAQRLSRMKLEERFCAAFICDFELPVLSDMAALGIDLAFGGFTQGQELEADHLGQRYLEMAGYDPGAMSRFLTRLKAQNDLEADIAGLSHEQRKARSYSSTHPLTEERIDLARTDAAEQNDNSPETGEWEYLSNIDGLLYGNRREYGFVIGNSYIHPIRRIAFNVPEGYTLYPDSRRVTAIGPDGAIMLFEPSRRLVREPMLDYLLDIWAEGVDLQDARALTINGLQAATGWLRRETEYGLVDFRLVAIRTQSGVVYRFLFISPSAMTMRLSEGMRTTTYSFRMIDPAQAEQIQPLRLRVIIPGEDVDFSGLVSMNRFPDHAEERFRALNGLPAGSSPKPGGLIKLVTD